MVKMGVGEQMKQKFLLTILILLAVAISACGGGAETTPTLSADALAQTAVAQAWLVITQTAAAMPSATPIPPTNTPEPTFTPPPTLALLPTLTPAPLGAISTPTSSTDPCNQIPVAEPKGALVTVEIENISKGSANLAFGMMTPNDKAECFTYSFQLGRGDMTSTKVLAGCYWGYAWITGEDTSVAKSGDKVMCMTDTAVVYHVNVADETVQFK